MSVRPKKRPYLPTLRPLQRDSRYPTREGGGTLRRGDALHTSLFTAASGAHCLCPWRDASFTRVQFTVVHTK